MSDPTMRELWCGGCGAAVSPTCTGAFRRRGIIRVHWECWSKCNLSCAFCFRSRSVPVEGAQAQRLVLAVAASGAEWLVFAGGDPSLRRDLPQLCVLARDAGLRVEIQTNADHITVALAEAVAHADSVGLSIDSAEAAVHDRLRGRKGNHHRVVELMQRLAAKGVSVRVRTLVCRETVDSVADLGILLSASRIARWCLQEFTPVGEGYRNEARFALPHQEFRKVVAVAAQRFGGRVEAVSDSDKVSAYAMVRSDGALYGTAGTLVDDAYPTVGDLLSDHLDQLAVRLPLDPRRHLSRYGEVSPGSDGPFGQ